MNEGPPIAPILRYTMGRLERAISGVLVGAWLWFAACGQAPAEDDVTTEAGQFNSIKAGWEERTLRRERPSFADRRGALIGRVHTGSWTPGLPTPTTTASGLVRPDEEEVRHANGALESIPPGSTEDSDESAGPDLGLHYAEDGGYWAPGHGTACGEGQAHGGYGPYWTDFGGYGWGLMGPGGAWLWRNLSLFAGVQGFKGPADFANNAFAANGNFGFHEGLNWGGALGGPLGWGYQVGCQAAQNDFSGTSVDSRGRDQVFLTAGLFRRAVYGGVQWGVAFDFLHDRYFDGEYDYKQIRTELSLVRAGLREIGFWGAFGTGTDHPTRESTDLYAFFYRHYFQGGGEGRIWSGFTGNGDALVGGDVWVPLGRSLALETNFNYLTAKQNWAAGGFREESWGVSMHLIWYPGQQAQCLRNNPYRPLFAVADNSVFMFDND